ncbi:MAG: succinate--CoA ligase subunit beta, partial [Caldilineae bacterium]
MRLTEAQAKQILREASLPVGAFAIVQTAAAAARAAEAFGSPVMLKAQIPRGGRGKAGGVRRASTPEEAGRIAGEMLGTTLLGYEVDSLVVEPAAAVEHEAFLAFTYDTSLR